MNIEPEASYIIAAKNPEKGSPPQAGLSGERKVDYPRSLQDKFEGRRSQDEKEWTSDIFKDLHMERSGHPFEPLFKGQWE